MRVYVLNILSKDLKGKGIYFRASAVTAFPFMCEKTEKLGDTTIKPEEEARAPSPASLWFN